MLCQSNNLYTGKEKAHANICQSVLYIRFATRLSNLDHVQWPPLWAPLKIERELVLILWCLNKFEIFMQVFLFLSFLGWLWPNHPYTLLTPQSGSTRFVVASLPTAALTALLACTATVLETEGATTRRRQRNRRMLTRQPPLITQSHRPEAAGREMQ